MKMMIVHISIWKKMGFSSGSHTTDVQGSPGPGTQTGFAQSVGLILRTGWGVEGVRWVFVSVGHGHAVLPPSARAGASIPIPSPSPSPPKPIGHACIDS